MHCVPANLVVLGRVPVVALVALVALVMLHAAWGCGGQASGSAADASDADAAEDARDEGGATPVDVGGLQWDVAVPGPSCNPVVRPEGPPFDEVGVELGITHVNDDVQYGGVCPLDFDLDGDLDLYFSNTLDAPNRMYRNDGDRFVDVTEETQTGLLLDGSGCLAVDFDGDGDPDLYTTQEGPDQLLRNDDGVFTNVTDEAGILGPLWSVSATAGDIDGDGDLDIYVARQDCSTMFCGRLANLLFVNQGDGTFVEEAADRGLTDEEPTLVALFMDIDEDGDIDIYCGNNHQYDYPDRVYINDGNGFFEDRAPEMGVDMNRRQSSSDTMGVDLGDYDLDGEPDLVLTNFTGSRTLLYDCTRREDGLPVCEDVARFVGLGDDSWLNWGVGFVNFDHDGDQDLFMASGLLNSMSGDDRDQLYWNEGGAFVFHEAEIDGPLDQWTRGSGASFVDYDNDGDMDIVVVNLSERPHVFRNRTASGNWLQIALEGSVSNIEGIGARVTVTAGECSLTEQRMSGAGFTSSHDPRLHFGLGTQTTALVEVVWPAGGTTRLEGVAANQVLHLVEGQ